MAVEKRGQAIPTLQILSIFLSFDFDIQPGQILEMTDGTNTKTRTVRNLEITVDLEANIVSGKAESGIFVFVNVCVYQRLHAHHYRGLACIEKDIPVSASGLWSFNYAEIILNARQRPDLLLYQVVIMDDEGNSTVVEWWHEFYYQNLPLILR
ncbi:MAG: hypothetical protein GX142_02945 [Chloroflexi bacterium]|jgi:hypothetical protein|nr:hypothetical protein [Chloroflexota bacterium]